MRTFAWLATVVIVGCGSPPAPVEPISATVVAPPTTPAEPAPAPAIHAKERILFAPNTPAMPASALEVLDRVLRNLAADPSLNLQVSGHTDTTEIGANDTGPSSLSHARATVVRSYLLSRGIPERRLLIRAVGAVEPRATNSTDVGRTANRRVEFEKVTIKVDPFGGRIVVTDTDVEILDPVTFVAGKDVLEKTSYPALDAVASTLIGNPSILLVEVQSHTDERGDDAANLALTDARANVVMKYLVGLGVDPARLTAQGYGETQPIDRDHTEAAWAKNRRIAFLILKRAP